MGLQKGHACLVAGRHKVVNGVQLACMRLVLAPITQSGSGTSHLGGGGNIGRAARMKHGDIQQGETMGQGRVTSMLARTP
jgi:hypothetical protein